MTPARLTVLTIETFRPFHEAHFRLLMGEVVFADQHGDHREQTASSPSVPEGVTSCGRSPG
ncbi:hypothetical protein [Streptosporangium sp. LJ11]|uniref:hypothetical protein n=1 Tax=Streptosporangium sp. LJ11 TaxID=3436927 RepID=UPI003F796234